MNGKTLWVRVAAAILSSALFVGVASAQQASDQWTVEALAAQAHVVFRGTITDILRLGAESKLGAPPRVSLMLTVHIEERIKGRPDSWMTLMRDTLASDTRYDLWMKSKASMLWFTFSEDDPRAFPDAKIGPGLGLQPGQSWVALHINPPDPAEVALDPTAGAGVMGMNLSVLSDGKARRDATTSFLKTAPDLTKVCRFQIPPSVTAAIGYPTGLQRIVVPVTPALEQTALKMISNPEAFLPKSHPPADATCIRAAGVKALANFNSEQNSALLKTLLNDPGKGPTDSTETPVKTFYWVRLAAYNALVGWGAKVPKPAL